MQLAKRISTLVLLPLFATGCASTGLGSMKTRDCAIAGAVLGAGTAAGATHGHDGRNASAGAVVGGLAGALICSMINGDADGDGVRDKQDQCPNSPAGTAVDSTGCALDSDGDGVADANDRCPSTPAGRQVDASGCQLDSDGDGVVDALDQCPGTAKGTAVDGKGCAKPMTITLSDIGGVNFAVNSAELTAAAKAKLDSLIGTLKSTAPRSIKVVGHTDSTGDAAYNQQLSVKRAQAVIDYLVASGIDAKRLGQPHGEGESSPVAPNNTRDGRAANRRVELHLM